MGDGTTEPSSPPVWVSSSVPLAKVYAGSWQHNCALDASGNAFCWGRGAEGQLGNGANADELTPVAVSGGLEFESLTLGDYHTCGLTADGGLYCWGSNATGQLGNGLAQSNVPVRAAQGHAFVEVAAGAQHTCGRTASGEVWCWGRNQFGELSSAAQGSMSETPVEIPLGVAAIHLAAGSIHTCILDASGGAWCWGCDVDGEDGSGLTAYSTDPVKVAWDFPFVQLALGYDFSCALDDTGAAICWGANAQMELGRDGGSQPLPGAAQPGFLFESLAAGAEHVCGLDASGQLWCWGSGLHQELGPAAGGQSSAVPVLVPP